MNAKQRLTKLEAQTVAPEHRITLIQLVDGFTGEVGGVIEIKPRNGSDQDKVFAVLDRGGNDKSRYHR